MHGSASKQNVPFIQNCPKSTRNFTICHCSKTAVTIVFLMEPTVPETALAFIVGKCLFGLHTADLSSVLAVTIKWEWPYHTHKALVVKGQ